MFKRKIAALIVVIAALLVMSATFGAAEELAKQGTFSGLYGWTYSGTIHQIEEGHIFIQDTYKGTFFNHAGKGYLHETSWICPAVTDLVNGRGTAKGYTICTDKDGDKVFSTWKGTVNPTTGFAGDWQYTGGTGKYTGITGNGTFEATLIGSTMEGRGIIRGKWRLP